MSLLSQDQLTEASQYHHKYIILLCRKFMRIHGEVPTPLMHLVHYPLPQQSLINKKWRAFYATAQQEAWELYYHKHKDEMK